jgi:putative ABC transport system ATP-binding protein
MLCLENLSKAFNSSEGSAQVLNKLNLTVPRGTSLAVLGESGSGKSTLLHIISGLEKPNSGSVKFENQNIWLLSEPKRAKIRREKMAVIFQQFNLVPSLTIIENIELHAKIVKKFDPVFIKNIVRMLKIEDILGKYPEQTSGGQQQRAAIARAVAAKPTLILADEPTGNLDEANTASVIKILGRLVTQSQTTLLVATHSQTLASTLNSQVILRKGKLTRNVS